MAQVSHHILGTEIRKFHLVGVTLKAKHAGLDLAANEILTVLCVNPNILLDALMPCLDRLMDNGVHPRTVAFHRLAMVGRGTFKMSVYQTPEFVHDGMSLLLAYIEQCRQTKAECRYYVERKLHTVTIYRDGLVFKSSVIDTIPATVQEWTRNFLGEQVQVSRIGQITDPVWLSSAGKSVTDLEAD